MKDFYKKQLAEDKKLIDRLLDDIGKCEESLKEHNTSFDKRTYIRTLFSFIEAMGFVFRRHALYAIELDLQCKARNALNLKDENKTHLKKWLESRKLMHEWSLLCQDGFVPGPTGKLVKKKNKTPFANYIAFSIRSYSQHSRWFDCSDFFADNGWNDFKKAIRIRNRITHPKTESDVEISEKEMKLIENASVWFQCVVRELGERFKMISTGKQPVLKKNT